MVLVPGLPVAALPARPSKPARSTTTTSTSKPGKPIPTVPGVTTPGVVVPVPPQFAGLASLSGPIQAAAKKSFDAHQAQAAAEADEQTKVQAAQAAVAKYEQIKIALIQRAQSDYVAPVRAPDEMVGDISRALEYLKARLNSESQLLSEAKHARQAAETASAAAQKAADIARTKTQQADAALASLAPLQAQQIALAQGLEIDGDEAPDGQIALAAPPLVSAEGIIVNVLIGQQVANLIVAAKAAKINLGGDGYRTTARQVELRVAHCGPTDFQVWQMPSSACSPPTARPGRSMHERGLAIDFSNDGSLISSHTDPGFIWLAQNAARFGLYNLPSEPWHWSVNGN